MKKNLCELKPILVELEDGDGHEVDGYHWVKLFENMLFILFDPEYELCGVSQEGSGGTTYVTEDFFPMADLNWGSGRGERPQDTVVAVSQEELQQLVHERMCQHTIEMLQERMT
ncbi:hypothetical protein [Paraburkholderia sp. BL10I2N1]|uniref:hypothetical protein n=1 Tax=Paraburkholderia sp. BL10I2N1 TaxID=1938796 RepID=UPI00105CC506|nr:hypothetical protein [Paraburkholderia sp. BL10I2N1]TDN70442.1 hypothetical protein B0G77_3916 [Paraburkholderia sp. BL10I2N1]